MKPAPPVTRYFILSPYALEYCTYRPQDNLEIHSKRAMFDVVKVIFEFDGCFCDASYIAIIDLRPAGEPWFNQQTGAIKRNLLLKFCYQLRSFCTRPYETHFSAKYIPKLWQFI